MKTKGEKRSAIFFTKENSNSMENVQTSVVKQTKKNKKKYLKDDATTRLTKMTTGEL